MTRFPFNDGPYAYRPLKRGVNGWDTYALQTGLLADGYDLGEWGADGYFGGATEKAVRLLQHRVDLTVDGIAGIVTQTHIGQSLASDARFAYRLPLGLPHGQIEHECGWQLGNYTSLYPSHKRDLGPVQQNRYPTDADALACFDVPRAIAALCNDPAMGIRVIHDRYKRNWKRAGEGPPGEEELWRLAVGHWNAPAITDSYVANGRQSLPAYLLDYIQACTKYVTEYSP